jgi:ABC-2 type transport system permease protein
VTTVEAITTTTPTATLASAPRPSLLKLTTVELRKLVDTRAGRWLLAVIVLGCAGMAAVQLAVNDPVDRDFQAFFLGSALPIGILLPVLGILTVTSEWSQRTTQTTFALVPQRGRVIAAKLAAGAVAAAGSVVASLVVGAVANLIAIGTGGDGGWEIGASVLGSAVLAQVVNLIMGLAFGMALLNTPLAIVAYFALPMIWSILGELVSALATAAEWLDFTLTMAPMLAGDTLTGQQWAQFGTSVAVWVLVPLALGVVRILRSEVN